MTRKHFEAIATALNVEGIEWHANLAPDSQRRHAHYVAAVANALAEFNPRFNFDTFMLYAGVDSSISPWRVTGGPFGRNVVVID